MKKHEEIFGGQGFVELVSWSGTDAAIASTARLTTGANSKGPEADRRLIRRLMRKRHTSPFEFAALTFDVKAPMFVVQQILRHRTFSFQQQSLRYRDVEHGGFYDPIHWRIPVEDSGEQADLDFGLSATLKGVTGSAFSAYRASIAAGAPPELARGLLPSSLLTTLRVDGKLKNVLDFLELRLPEDAQMETREVALKVAAFVEELFPCTYEAFLDYRLRAVTFSQSELRALRALLAGDQGLGSPTVRESLEGMTFGEEMEFREKMAALTRGGSHGRVSAG